MAFIEITDGYLNLEQIALVKFRTETSGREGSTALVTLAGSGEKVYLRGEDIPLLRAALKTLDARGESVPRRGCQVG